MQSNRRERLERVRVTEVTEITDNLFHSLNLCNLYYLLAVQPPRIPTPPADFSCRRARCGIDLKRIDYQLGSCSMPLFYRHILLIVCFVSAQCPQGSP
jgi:hypothetical protein